LALLRGHLDTVAAAFADVDETVPGRMRTMQRRRELLLIRGWPGYVVGRRGIVIDFVQGSAVASPASLESARIHVVDEHALIQKTVGDIDLAGVFIEFESRNSRRENGRLLVILLHLIRRHFGAAMSKVRKEFTVLSELDDAVAGHGAREIHVQVAIHTDRLQSAGPAGNVSLIAPSLEDVAVSIELKHF